MAQPLERGEWVKYHALGNDYLVMDATLGGAQSLPTPEAIQSLCARHRGVGSDGLLLQVQSPADANAALRIFNPDGSEAEKSGNGLRIFARYCLDFGVVQQSAFVLAVGPERIACTLTDAAGRPARPAEGLAPAAVANVRCAMGTARFEGAAVHLTQTAPDTRRMALTVDGTELDVTLVGLGNPHCVAFGPSWTVAELRRLGPQLERHPLFARRTNVQLASVRQDGGLDMLVWERGAGETSASGSSSCAVAAAAHVRGLCGTEVTVHMPGGTLAVGLNKVGGAPANALALTLTGPATPVARGVLWV